MGDGGVLIVELDLERRVRGRAELGLVVGDVLRDQRQRRRRRRTRLTRRVRPARRLRWGRRRRCVGRGDLLLEPRIEVGAGHRVDVEMHLVVAFAAQLGALAVERPADILVLEGELEAVGPARHHVSLEQELRDVEGVDDVRALEVEVDGPADRQRQAAIRTLGLGDRQERLHVLVRHRVIVVGQVLERPEELGGRRADLHLRLRRGDLDRVERQPRRDEQDSDDERGDDRPDHLGDRVAMRLRRKLVVTRLASIADDRPDDQPFDDEEDDDRDPEHQVVQLADVFAAIGDGLRREEAGRDALADPHGVEAQDDHRDDPEDQDGADDHCDERWGRAAGPGGTRHAAPRCGWGCERVRTRAGSDRRHDSAEARRTARSRPLLGRARRASVGRCR